MGSALLCFVSLCCLATTAPGFMMRCANIDSGVRMMASSADHIPPSTTTTKTTTATVGRRVFVQSALASIPLLLGAPRAFAAAEETEKKKTPTFNKSTPQEATTTTTTAPGGWEEPEVTQKGYMDMIIDGKPAGRLVISLYGKVVPNTVKNFVALLTGKNVAEVSYKGTEAYRVLDGLNIQMGAIGSRSGKSGVSSTGENIAQENFDIPHMKEGLLSMVRNQDAQGDSRFFISIKDDAGWADNRYVAFGRISEGMDIVHKIERVKVDGGTNHPKSPVLVDDCGLL